jgi:hypothetical protein
LRAGRRSAARGVQRLPAPPFRRVAGYVGFSKSVEALHTLTVEGREDDLVIGRVTATYRSIANAILLKNDLPPNGV